MARAALAAIWVIALAMSAAAGPDEGESTTMTSIAPETTSSSTETSTTSLPASSTTSSTTTSTAPETTTSLPATTTTTPPTTLPPPPGCVPGDPRTCDDGDPCTLDACDAASRACVHAPLDGTPCSDDGIGCTEDRCASGVCTHHPSDLRCDRGACAVRACRPSDPGADREGCILLEDQSGTDGTPCTGDGFSCTEDVCMDGLCMHMPVDSACVPADACRAAACAPSLPGHDAAGCVAGSGRDDGQACAEDADVCTVDVCRAGTCAHEPQTDTTGCAPVQDAFHQAIALDNLTQELGAAVSIAGPPAVERALGRLAEVEADLQSAARALAGDTPGPALAGAQAGVPGSPAAERARIAFTMVLRTPRAVSAFLQTLAQARTRAAVGRPVARQLRRRGRVLLQGTRRLRASLRTLAR
jgi:hypothetical protein